MCRAFRLLSHGDDMPLDVFIRQVRRWCLTDFLLAIIYIVYAVTQSGILASMCWLLSVFYALDGVSLGYITNPSRVYTISASTLYGNTLLNIITLGINLAYNALEIKLDGFKSPVLVLLAIFIIVYKSAKCLVIAKLAKRLINEKPDVDSYTEPLTVQSQPQHVGIVVDAVPVKN